MRLTVLSCAITLWMASPASADPFSISILNTTHTVTLRDRTYYDGGLTETIRTTSSNTAPVSDSYLVQAVAPYNFIQGGTASAELFEVSTWTSQGKLRPENGSLAHMWAYATSELTFTPVSSGTALIDVGFLLGGMFLYSETTARLVDLTTSTDVWNVGWGYRSDPTIMQTLAATPTSFATSFDSSHSYQLMLYARTDASDDTQSVTARVTGLQAVPEPSTMLLVGLGSSLAALAKHRSRRQRDRRDSNRD